MYKIIFCTILYFATVYGLGSNMIGAGIWNIINIEKYEEEDAKDFYLKFDVTKRRLSRKEGGYNVTMDLEKEFDESHAMHVDICKKVDGGCKPYQVLSDKSVVHFIEEHTKDNLDKFLMAAGFDPPEFPLSAGTYRVENFVVNYCDLPPNGPYGEYQAVACILKEAKRIGCVVANVEFLEDNDDVCERNDE